MLLLLLACARPPLAPPPTPPSSPPPHGEAATAARDALVFGDLAGWRDGVVALTDAALPGVDPARRAAFVAEVQPLAAAPDLAGAARATGQVAQACARCHAAERATIPLTAPPEVEGDGVRPEMARHHRALDLAWTGLVAPAPAALTDAADAFAASFLSPPPAADLPAVHALDEAVTLAADRLRAARSDADRADAFAALLLTCHTCHATRPGGLALEPE